MNNILMRRKEGSTALARKTDPNTSHDAAQSMKPHAGKVETIVADAINSSGLHGMICDEIVAKTGLKWNTVSPRLRPLVRKGIIKKKWCPTAGLTGKPYTRVGKSNRSQIVWISAKCLDHYQNG